MHVVCADPITRTQLADRLSLADAEHAAIVVAGSANSVHAYFGTPDFFENVVVAITDIGENNLKYAIRYMLSNAEKSIKLAIVMDEWNEVLGERLEQVIRTEYRRAENNNSAEIDRIKNLRDSTWKTERLRELEKWRTIPAFQYATFRNGSNLDIELKKFFSDTSCSSQVEERHIAQKPPLLHWTALPLEEEMQVVLRFSFSLYGPAVSVLRSAAEASQSSFDSTYHWTHGVLLTREPVRVHIQLLTSQRLEVAGRVAVDELEGEEAKEPLKVVWPYLSVVTRNLRDELRRHQHIQYSMEIIPFGSSLFIPPIDCRVFDLTLFMTTLLKFGKVGFKLGETIHEVDIRTLFPDSIPSSLAEMCSQTPPSPSLREQKTNGSIIPSFNEKMSPFGYGNSSPPTQNSLKVTHNRGRRVSFGTIKCDGEAFRLDDGQDG